MNHRIAVPLLAGLLLLAPLAWAQDAEPAPAEPQAPEAASQDAASDSGPNIYPHLAAGLVEMDAPVLDVRSDEEVEETGVVADARHIPHTEIDAMVDYLGENKDRAVVVYCRSGRRADMAINALRDRGYTGFVNAGGYQDLQAALQGDDE